MRTMLKVTATLYNDLVQQLREPHDFAGERVAFLKCRPALSATSLLLLAGAFVVVARRRAKGPSLRRTMRAAATRGMVITTDARV